MTDKELLELAAKAAGIKYDKAASFPPDGKTYSFFGLWLVIEGEPNERTRRRWNPLTDDGDALRLAVKLNLILMPYPRDNAVRVTRLDQPDTIVSFGDPPDTLAATRRAIVIAAAELAKHEVKG